MASEKDVKFVLSAADRTAAAFRGVQGRLQGIERSVGVLNASLGRLAGVFGGVFAGATLTAFVGAVSKSLDQLVDLRDATGASVENLSALEDVAARTGTSFEGMAGTLVRFNKVLGDADPGSRTEQVLKSIGLSAKELRQLDPAEALRRTAVAIEQYGDKGNKARLVQELFQKSIREAGPLLNELAKQTKLTATVTTEQAEAAERFNQELLKLQKNATDAGRTLISGMLPALNEILRTFTDKGLIAALDKFGNLAFDWEGSQQRKQMKVLQRDLDDLQKRADAIGEVGARKLGITAQLDAKRAELEKARAAYLKLTDGRAGGGRGFVNPALVDVRPDAPGLPDGDVAKRAAELAKRVAEGKAAITEQMNKELVAVAEAIVQADFEGAREFARVLTEAAGKRADTVSDAFRRSELESTDKVNEALRESMQKRAEELSDFALEARRNVQDAVGDTLLQGLEGDFDRIEQLWGSLLKRMVAQAIAAQLNEALFGKTGKGSDVGLIGGIFGAIFGGGMAEGGPVRGGTPYLVGERGPEIFVPRGSGSVLNNDTTRSVAGLRITSAPQIYIDSRTDAAQVQRMVAAGVAEGNRQLVNQLRAQGVM